MTRKTLTALLLGSSILGTAGAAFAQDKTITIESWRNDDLAIWQEKLIPAFEAANPGIKVVFSPSAPTEYNAALNAKLDAGSAGDLITCRPFDASLELYNKGHLADLTDAARHGELLRRRQVRLDDRRRQGRPSACRWPRSSTASSTTRTPSTSSASPCRPPKPSSSPRSTRSRPTAPTSRWRWAPRISGKPRPWATRTSARTTGRARKAVWR